MIANNEIVSPLTSLMDYLALKPAVLHNHQTRYLIGAGFDRMPDEAKFKLVSQRIRDHFLLVGPLERFDEFVLVLFKLMGWDFRPYVRRNVGEGPKREKDQDSAVLGYVARHNTVDQALHQLSHELLDEAINSYRGDFATDLSCIQELNRQAKSDPSLVAPPTWRRLLGQFKGGLSSR
jgi:hypothetical protein